nr:hypothetical protein HmN_000524500 [Hymenolepis microstoma]
MSHDRFQFPRPVVFGTIPPVCATPSLWDYLKPLPTRSFYQIIIVICTPLNPLTTLGVLLFWQAAAVCRLSLSVESYQSDLLQMYFAAAFIKNSHSTASPIDQN